MRKHAWLAFLLLIAISAATGCQPQGERESRSSALKASLALVPNSYSGLIGIADAKGFFEECGLEVSAKEYPSGREAVEAVMRGEAQMATGADMVMAVKVFDDPSLRVVASIGSSSANEIVARKDRDIRVPADLKGRKIGYSSGTSSEYYLDAFLLANAIAAHDVSPVNIPPASITDALVSGEVDAMSSWDVNVYSARKRLGENGVSWPAQNYLDWYWLLIVREELTLSPEPLRRFLRALLMAESFLLTNENEARSILTRKWGFDPEFIGEVWEKTRLNVALNQSMITSLENFARGKMKKEGKIEPMPNYLRYTFTGVLDEIEPRTVTLFR
jgi:NitT/TauT family transport system substrate-binding protein